MQRWWTKLRSVAALHSSTQKPPLSLFSTPSHRLLHHSSPNFCHKPLCLSLFVSNIKPLFNAHSTPKLSLATHSPLLPTSFIHVRHITAAQKRKKRHEKKLKRRKPMTPVTSKVKKIKMKSYSSYKYRFRTLKDGTIRRWREGKRHNAHSKSKEAKRRLRQPAVVPLAYAKVMKKLNFCG